MLRKPRTPRPNRGTYAAMGPIVAPAPQSLPDRGGLQQEVE